MTNRTEKVQSPLVSVTPELAGVVKHYLEAALEWQPINDDGEGRNGLTIRDTLKLMCVRMESDLAAIAKARVASQ